MQIPPNIRKLENLHIVFWLFKDMSWCMGWKYLGIFMILPTIGVSIWTTIKTKHIVSELYHTIAVLFWIIANSYWMISEFLGFDEVVLFQGILGKHLAIVPFFIGILVLGWFYLSPKKQ